MNGLYGYRAIAGFSGADLFAKAVNLLVTDAAPSATSVMERKNLIRQRLSQLLDAPAPSVRPLRLLSIAAGPAQETYELLESREVIPHPIEIVLFDQDRRALAFAHSRLSRLAAKWGERVRIVHLHAAIQRLLNDATLFARFGTFDMIFSCGLFVVLTQSA